MEGIESKPFGTEKKIWTIGGGKGGTGKTMITSSLGIQLSRMGNRVLVIDADLGGANLHTFLGMKYPRTTLSDFLSRKVKSLTDILIDTPFENLKIISGANDFLDAANPFYSQKLRLINHIKGLPIDYIIVDIGSGTSYNVLDFFILSNSGILVTIPEPTSVENLYRFLKGSVLRILKFSMKKEELKKFSQAYADIEGRVGDRNINNLLKHLRRVDKELAEKIRLRIERFKPKLIINQVRDKKDVNLGRSISQVAERYLGIKINYIGYVPYDDNVFQSLKTFKPFIVENPDCPASVHLHKVGKRLVDGVVT